MLHYDINLSVCWMSHPHTTLLGWMLWKSIRLNMKQLKATDVLASKQVMLIARSLMKLLETFGDGHKGRFLDYVNSRLGISKSSYYYYMEHYAFMSKYPKFQTLAVSFRVFRSMIPKIKEWFMSQECQALDSSDFYSEHYWMNVDDEMDDDDMNVLNEHNSTAVENLRNK
ncbi:Glycerol kinase [Batrachochytrium dendrobatidis]